MSARRSHRQQVGLSLIEVLVTMVIIAISMLGLAGLQARSLSLQVDSEARRTASVLVSQLRERVSSNQQGFGQALTTGYSATMAPGAGAVTVPGCVNPDACDAALEVPPRQVAMWMNEVRRLLPEAAVAIGPAIAGEQLAMAVTIGWLEPNADAVASDAQCARIAAVATDARYRCLTVTFYPG